jgi:hypothetical protein
MPLSSAAPDSAPAKPKTFWGTVITMTPVVLTLLSTLLAGLSSSEMTRAQYYRSLAAQYQSKAGDQWSFFQGKRIRETILAVDIDLHPAKPMRVEPARLRTSLEAVIKAIIDVHSQCLSWMKAINDASLAESGEEHSRAILRERLGDLNEKTAPAKQPLEDIRDDLSREDVAIALSFLGTERLPGGQANDKPLGDERMQAALKAVQERRTERQLAALVAPIDETDLQQAVENAESNAKAFEDASQPVDRALEKIDRVVASLIRAAYQIRRRAEEISAAVDAGNSEKDRWRKQASSLNQASIALEKTRQSLVDYDVARKDYTVRRNKREARYNQAAAGPYELRVAKSGVTSDRHRTRSQRFFFGMLCAQAGAAIGSLAVAARQKSGLWSLAGLAGIIAAAFSVYVYLFV